MNDQTRTLRIIWAAMLLGQLMYFVVTLLITAEADHQPGLVRVMVPAVFLVLIAAAGASVALGMMPLPGAADRRANPAMYATRTIIRLALLEGPSLFGLTVFLLTRNTAALAASAVAFMLMVLMFPKGLHETPS